MNATRFQRSEEDVQDPLLAPLFNDMVDCEDLFDRSDTQFVRRTFVRCSFAFIEGHINWLRTHLIQWLSGNSTQPLDLLAVTLTLLRDDNPRPDKQGKLSNDSNRLPFLNHCAFVLRTAAEHAGADADQFFSDNGWNEIQKSLTVRHRITHPKCPEDLEIADAEINSVRESHRWIYNCTAAIINALQAKCGNAR